MEVYLRFTNSRLYSTNPAERSQIALHSFEGNEFDTDNSDPKPYSTKFENQTFDRHLAKTDSVTGEVSKVEADVKIEKGVPIKE